MSEERIIIPCADLILEAVWHFPEVEAALSSAVIVCHPHSLYGGNMSSKVVVAICRALARRSIAALRFNFRGVGRSTGAFGNGVGEQDDVEAAIDLVLSTDTVDSDRIGLAGYSFGAGVALAVAVRQERCRLLALVSPALTEAGYQQMKEYSGPEFIIAGEFDSIISHERLEKYISRTGGTMRYDVIPGADHFWRGCEEEVADKVARFFADGFSQI